MKGPIKVNETQYADYDFGTFNDGNYQHIDTSAYREFMGRLTVNPLGGAIAVRQPWPHRLLQLRLLT